MEEANHIRPTKRIDSLDVFRGLTVAFMIIVNSQGGDGKPYDFVMHAEWIGFTLADLVFPSFLFAMGLALSFGNNNQSSELFWKKTLRRTAILFVIGYVMFWFPFFYKNENGIYAFQNIDSVRIMGVLQRIAICFLISSIVVRYVNKKFIPYFCFALLIVYTSLFYINAGLVDPYDKTQNIVSVVDRALIGADRMYRGGAKGYDPEGLLSTIPAVVNVLAGYLSALALKEAVQTRTNSNETLIKLVSIGLILVFIASIIGYVIPISKNLWTGTFVLLTVGIDIILICSLFYLDKFSIFEKCFDLFKVFGENPLAIYVLSVVSYVQMYRIKLSDGSNIYDFVVKNCFQVFAPGPLGSLLCSMAFMMIFYFIGLFLVRRKIYIKI